MPKGTKKAYECLLVLNIYQTAIPFHGIRTIFRTIYRDHPCKRKLGAVKRTTQDKVLSIADNYWEVPEDLVVKPGEGRVWKGKRPQQGIMS